VVNEILGLVLVEDFLLRLEVIAAGSTKLATALHSFSKLLEKAW
jgi:hypothetical protein